jgi:Domain of unknown function (DUF4397)
MKPPRFLSLGGALLLAGGVFALATPAQAADNNATVSILHGVPGATVDIYANGKALLTDFKPGTLTDPQQLPAGTYDLKVVKAGDGADGDPVIEANNVKVPGGANITVAAHLGEDGDPTLTPFVNDVSTIPTGSARVIVRHTAAAPAVDVRGGGDPVFTNLSNPDQKSAEVDAGTLKADVVLKGTDNVVLGPASLKLGEGTTTIVYAWGSAEDDNLKLAVQMIKGMHSVPGGVQGGTGGQAAVASSAASPVVLAMIGLGLLGVVVSATGLARARVPINR